MGCWVMPWRCRFGGGPAPGWPRWSFCGTCLGRAACAGGGEIVGVTPRGGAVPRSGGPAWRQPLHSTGGSAPGYSVQVCMSARVSVPLSARSVRSRAGGCTRCHWEKRDHAGRSGSVYSSPQQAVMGVAEPYRESVTNRSTAPTANQVRCQPIPMRTSARLPLFLPARTTPLQIGNDSGPKQKLEAAKAEVRATAAKHAASAAMTAPSHAPSDGCQSFPVARERA